MKKVTYSILLILMIAILASSCKRVRANRIAGEYFCTYSYRYWDASPYSEDTTYDTHLTIENDGKVLLFLNQEVPIDCLDSDGYYERNYHGGGASILATKDSFLYSSFGGGLGGGSSRKYRCGKID